MKKIFTELCIVLALTLGLIFPLAQTAGAYSIAAAGNQACQGVDQAGGDAQGTCSANAASSASGSTISSLISKIVNWFSVIVGVIAVIMIIVSGLKFMTSGGESNAVAAAKKSLIYAIIGLVVVALAQIIVHFVLAKAPPAVSSILSTPIHL